MASSDLTFKVNAQVSGAVSGFRRLAASLKPVQKDADAASKSMAKMGKTKVTPKVDDKQLHKLKTEVDRLQDEMRKQLELDITADTRPFQRKIAGLKSSMRALSKTELVPQVPPSRFSSIKSGMAGVGKGFLTTASEIGNVVSALGPIVGGVARGIVDIGAAAGGSVLSMLTLSDSLEQNKIAFTTLLGSGEKAGKFLTGLEKFAAKTPFSFPELTDASKKLLAFGFKSKEIVPTLTAIGDAAGNTGADVNQLATIFGQMKAKGKLATEDIVQLVEAGIPAWDILADKLNVSKQKVQELATEGKLGGDALDKLLAGVGKKFGGGMAKQAETLSGLISTLQDTWDQTKTKIGAAIAPFATVGLKSLQDGLDTFSTWAISKIPGIIDTLEDVGMKLVDLPGQFLRGIGAFIQTNLLMKAAIEQSLSSISTTIGQVLTSLGGIIKFIPGFSDLGFAMEDAGTKAGEAGTKLHDASVQSGKDAVAQKEKWDAWADAYDQAATKYKEGIKSGAAKARIVFAKGELTRDLSEMQAQMDKLKAHPKANAEQIEALSRKINTAKTQLALVDAYTANPKLLAEDLASGTIEFVDGKLVDLDGRPNPKIAIEIQKQDAEADIASAKGKLAKLESKKWTPKVGADIKTAKEKLADASGRLDALNKKKAVPKAGMDKKVYQAGYNAVLRTQKALQKSKSSPKVAVSSNAAEVARNTTSTLNGIGDETVYVNVYKRDMGTTSAGGSGASVTMLSAPAAVIAPTPAPVINLAPVAATAAPVINVHLNDKKLADLINVRVAGAAATTRQIVARRGVIAL